MEVVKEENYDEMKSERVFIAYMTKKKKCCDKNIKYKRKRKI